MENVTKIKCLMIGQAGIGKTTFLENLPNSSKLANCSGLLLRENYIIETINSKFEKIQIEIENCDISLETCLYETDLTLNNKVIPSNQFINTMNYSIIILALAIDDSNSYELIKSKWEIDLKRNKSKKHSFILLGLKADSNKPNENKNTSKNEKKNQEFFDNDSLSINNHQIPMSVLKKFSKLIGSINFIRSSCTNQNESTKEKLNSYEKLIKNILIKHEAILNDTKSRKKIIPKSISAPMNLIVNLKIKQSKDATENTSIIQNELKADIQQQSQTETVSIKTKLSRLAVGLGTYIVTCGTHKSRKLANMKQFRNANENQQSKKLIKKNNSWLLLASEMSLNSIENDDVFSN